MMSAATIDRYLREYCALLEPKGISATRAGAMLRQSITIRKAGDDAEEEPGFMECDIVAHCGPHSKENLQGPSLQRACALAGPIWRCCVITRE